MQLNCKKTSAIALCVALAANAFAMLNDDEALAAARATLAKMTLEEKTQMCAGSGTMTLPAIPRVGIDREWTMSDNSSTVRAAMDNKTFSEPKNMFEEDPELAERLYNIVLEFKRPVLGRKGR